jgi:hypothetical protein
MDHRHQWMVDMEELASQSYTIRGKF